MRKIFQETSSEYSEKIHFCSYSLQLLFSRMFVVRITLYSLLNFYFFIVRKGESPLDDF